MIGAYHNVEITQRYNLMATIVETKHAGNSEVG